MKILGIAKNESGIQTVKRRLKEAGLYDRYEGHMQGHQSALIMVRVRNAMETKQVEEIFQSSGLIPISQPEEKAAGA